MTLWIRFQYDGAARFGTLEGDTITVYAGDMFGVSEPTTERLPLADARVLRPCEPTKMIGLWNNFHALATATKMPIPEEPLYFLKNPAAFADPDAVVHQPKSYEGKVVYEGELGIVLGKAIRDASPAEAKDAIFGYTIVNDITAVEILNRDRPSRNGRAPRGSTALGHSGR